MKYYKDGFFLEQSDNGDRTEITDEYWMELLECQSNGKTIISDSQGYPIAQDKIITEKELLNKELDELLLWFDEYDNQCKQYNRYIRLNETFDKDINQLDNSAKIKAARIKEIRNLLK